MLFPKKIRFILFLFLINASVCQAEAQRSAPQRRQKEKQVTKQDDQERELTTEEKIERDFSTEDAFLDVQEAIRSKQYVRRAVLSTVIRATNKFTFKRMYINHIMGFNAIYQRTLFAKFVSGVQGLSVGYVSDSGHAFEAGLEVSAVSNIFAGYRYIYRPETFSLWPFFGGGIGSEVSVFSFAEGPPEARLYNGMKQMVFATTGILIPLVDVGLKAEFRFNFYGTDRYILTQGIGAVIFF